MRKSISSNTRAPVKRAGLKLCRVCFSVAICILLACAFAQTPQRASVASVHITPLAVLPVNKTRLVRVTLPQGCSNVTLALRSKSGAGWARFADGSTFMTVNETSTVEIEGLSESSAEGDVQLEARSGEQVVASTAFTVFRVDSLQASMPSTKNGVTGSAPPAGIFTTSNASLEFATANTSDLMVVVQATEIGTPTIKANVGAADAGNQLGWRIDRDPTDTVAAGTPLLSASTGNSVVVTPNTAGNFRVICYYDSNDNQGFDAGEELKVLRMAVVRITVEPGHAIVTQPGYTGDGTSILTEGAMNLRLDAMLEGGGADRRIGVNKIMLGDVGNLVRDDFTVHYPVANSSLPAPRNIAGTGRENPGAPTPMIDSRHARPRHEPAGGAEAFRITSTDEPVTGAWEELKAAGGKGQVRRVTAYDSPGFYWDESHPFTHNKWATTEGGNAFREYVVAFSKTFPKYYAVLATGDWTVFATGLNNRGQWQSDHAKVVVGNGTANSVPLVELANGGTPTPGDRSGVQVLGLSFVNEFKMDYDPKPARR